MEGGDKAIQRRRGDKGGAMRRRREMKECGEREQRENTVGVLSGDEFDGAGDRAGLHEPTDFGI